MNKTIWTDIDLYQQGHWLVKPFDTQLVNPNSLDVRLGTDLLIETENDKNLPFTIDSFYRLLPGQSVLGCTLEYLTIPADVCALFYLKSTTARGRLNHALAGVVDAGFNGVLTLELKNDSQYHEYILKPGMRIGQLIFFDLANDVKNPYSGRYQNDVSVSGAKYN